MSNFTPENNQCPLCMSPRIRRFSAYASDEASPALVCINECKDCVFAWQYPVGRSEQQSIAFFKAAYADGGETQSSYFNPNRKREIAILEYKFLEELPVDKGELLDIGSGAGLFAQVADENGWSVTALDPALDEQLLKNSPRIRAIKGTIDSLPNEKLFDVITLWDVIEHVADPVELVSVVKSRLKKGGWLIVETGNYKSVERINEGINHWIYQLDHKWYFSPDSMGSLLSRLGFSDLTFSKTVLRPSWESKPGYDGPSKIDFIKLIIKRPWRFFSLISKYRYLAKAKNWEMPGLSIFAVAARKR